MLPAFLFDPSPQLNPLLLPDNVCDNVGIFGASMGPRRSPPNR